MGTPNLLGDAVLFTSTTTGAGTYAVGNPVAGYFAAWDAGIASGSRVGYTAVDSLTAPTAREVGEGVLSGSGTSWTLTRATIRASLLAGVAGSSAINWPSGTRYIFLTNLAVNTPQYDTDGWLRTTKLLQNSLGVPAIPTASSGAGNFFLVAPGDGQPVDLPSGGTWAYWILRIDNSNGTIDGNIAGNTTAGGTNVGAALAGRSWIGWAWRVE